MSGGRRIAARRGGRRCERFLTASGQGRERFLMAFHEGCGRCLLRRGRLGSLRGPGPASRTSTQRGRLVVVRDLAERDLLRAAVKSHVVV